MQRKRNRSTCDQADQKFPTNIKARELIVDLYIKNFESSNAQQEIKELLELKENDFKYIEKLKKKYSLQ